MRKIILFLIVFGVVFSGLSISDVTVYPEQVAPGGYATVTATLSSTLTLSSSGTVLSGGDTIKRIEVEFFSYGALEETPNIITFGDLDPGASTQVSVPIKIKSDAESGNYLFKIKAS